MKKTSRTAILSCLLPAAAALLPAQPATAGQPEFLVTDTFAVGIQDGAFSNLLAYREGRDYLPGGVPAPILQIRLASDGGAAKDYPPKSMTWTDPGKEFTLHYDTSPAVDVRVGVQTKHTHLVFEVLEITPPDTVDLVLWGPVPTTIGKRIGESVGVVQGETFAIGIQALNVKTLGGYPGTADSCDYTSIRQTTDENQYENIFEKVSSAHRMWGDTAWRKPFGSVLQAFARDRSNPGSFELMGFAGVQRESIADEGPVHSKIALFGCPVADALHTIGQIEVAENLPHPLIDGEWVKESPKAISTYLADTYNANPGLGGYVDHYLDWADGSHVRTFYFPTPGPFRGVGHYSRFNTGWFPETNGDHGVAKYTETLDKIKNAGFWIGTHTMSGMISMNDLYVSQVDPRLKSYGSCKLVNDVAAADTSFTVTDISPNMQGPTGRILRFDSGPAAGEIIQYGSKTDLGGGTYRLENILRARYGTTARNHSAGTLGHIMWHDTTYDSTSGNGTLNLEVARNLADYAHQYGVKILTMDGLEAAWSEGHGEYSRTRFANEFFTRLRDTHGRSDIVLSASNAGHFLWHIVGRYEWGDESLNLRSGDTRYRNMNQSFYERNLLPKFMGGYLLREEYDLDDIEWFCSKAAGFDAGFSLDVVNPVQVKADSDYQQIVDAMKAWTAAREAGAFPPKLKRHLQDSSAEFHIEQLAPDRWRLYSRPDPNDRTILSSQYIDIPLDRPATEAELAIFAPMPRPKAEIIEATNTENGYPPQNTIDGQMSTQWQAVPMPASLVIDLSELQRIDSVTVFPFFEPDGRRWWYTLDISTDNQNWTRAGTASGIEADADGDTWSFSARQVRYIKLEVTQYEFRGTPQNTAIIREITWNSVPLGPTVRIASPDNLASLSPDSVLVARGIAQDGAAILDDSAFSWSSDIDGDLGTGRVLPVSGLSRGKHHFSVTLSQAGHSSTKSIDAFVRPAEGAVSYPGVNLLGGQNDTQSNYPSPETFRHFAAQGMCLARIPFKWERLQPALDSPLDETEAAKLDAALSAALQAGMRAVVVPYNHAAYQGHTIGSSSLPASSFADLWSRLAARYKDRPNIWFGLMHAPENITAADWFAAANLAIQAIRDSGATNRILVPGAGGSIASEWTTAADPNSTAIASVHDPAGNWLVEVYQFLDAAGDGSGDDIAGDQIGSSRLDAFTQWCRTSKRRAILAEFACPRSDTGEENDPAYAGYLALDDMLAWLDENRDVWQGWAWWAAGDAPDGNRFSIQPVGSSPPPQLAFLKKHIENTPPSVRILSPAGPAIISANQGETITFSAEATDAEDGELVGASLVWSSSVNGVFGQGASVRTASLSPGRHIITLTATDSRAGSASSMLFLDISGPEISVSSNQTDIENGDFDPETANNTDFGTTTVGSTITRQFTISNSGDSTLHITGVSIQGAGFSLATAPPASLAPGASAAFSVSFSPAAAGTAQATISIQSDDNDETSFQINLRAEASSSPEPRIAVSGPHADISNGDTSPAPGDGTDFQGVPPGGKTVDFTIRNTGTARLDISSATVSGTGFSVATPPASSIDPGASTTLGIHFDSAGPSTGQVSIESNDSANSPFLFSLAAEGGLAIHLPLDESSGTTASDASGNNRHGLLEGGFSFDSSSVPGKSATALQFDGAGDVSIQDADAFSPSQNNISLSIWIKPPDNLPDGTFTIVSKTDDAKWEWELRLSKNSSGILPQLLTYTLDGHGSAGSVSANQYIPPNTWSHIVATLDYGNTMKIYIDGTLRGTAASQATMGNGTAELRLATRNHTNYFTGALDDFRLYSALLSETAIQTIHDSAGQSSGAGAPSILLSEPADMSSAGEGDTVPFSGSASDPEDGSLSGRSLQWRSDIQGFLGSGESFSRNDLLAGTHTITLTATDSEGHSATASATLRILAAQTPTHQTGAWYGAPPLPYTGVNLAGAEFGSIIPGTYGANYTYPTIAEIDYFASKGMNTIRLPFRWERLQRSLQADFDPDEWNRLDSTVQAILQRGMIAILDPHNSARYNGDLVGTAAVPTAAFADFWRRLALAYSNQPGVWFGLVNEPYGIDAADWLTAANQAIAAIRNAGAENLVLVPGTAFSGAHSWLARYYGTPNGDVMDGVIDPADNFAIEVHQYLDSDSSGTHDSVVAPDIGSRRLAEFTAWCRQKGIRAFLGEFACPRSDTGNLFDPYYAGYRAIDDMLAYMEDNRDVWLGWTWWAAGPWWGEYMFALDPDSSGSDRPQLAVALASHIPGTDTDSDQIADTWELARFGASGADPDADPDADGLSNLAEYLAGTDPFSPDSAPMRISLGASGTLCTLRFDTLALDTGLYPQGKSRLYDIESTTDLLDPSSWQPIAGHTGIPADGSTHTLDIPMDDSIPRKFFRLRIRLQ
jgi:endoglucanase